MGRVKETKTKSTTPMECMSPYERSMYLESVEWVRRHRSELKSIGKGNLFMSLKNDNGNVECSLYPHHVNRSQYVVMIHTMNEDVINYIINSNEALYVYSDMQNCSSVKDTFADAVSDYIRIVRNIRDNVLENKSEITEPDEDVYSKPNVILTSEQLEEIFEKIPVEKTPVKYKLSKNRVIYASSMRIKYGSPTVKLIQRQDKHWEIQVYLDKNLNQIIRDDLESYMKSKLDLERKATYDGFLWYNTYAFKSFNQSYNEFRKTATDIIVYILQHPVFKSSCRKKR